MGEIDAIKADQSSENLDGLRGGLADRLFDEVSGMSLDNFIVRPKRRYVEKFQERDAWQTLDGEARGDLAEHVAGLPSALEDDDIAAKQFDYMVLTAQLAMLRADPAFVKIKDRIISVASKLEELGNVPMVAAHMTLILEAQTEEYWQDINPPILETLRRRLRDLVKLIEASARKIVYTDFEDEIGAGSTVDLPDIEFRHGQGAV